jgi:hypothetical protein
MISLAKYIYNKSTVAIILFFLALLGIFAAQILLQHHLIMSQDISWFLHIAARLIAGGNYYDNFFDVNPPMSMYIYLPVVIIAKHFGLGYIKLLPVYIFLIACVSLILNYILLSKLLDNKQRITLYVGIVALAFIFLLLPAYEFGQREHLSLMLIVPYILLAGIRCDSSAPHWFLVIIVGLLAGIGFNIKPYFLINWAVIECYLLFTHRRISYVFRPEALLVISVTVAYFVSIVIFTPEYIYKVLPLITRLYYATFAQPLYFILMFPQSSLTIAILLICYPIQRYLQSKVFINLLYVSAIVQLIIALYQRTIWYYHFYPALGLIALLAVFLLLNILQAKTVLIKAGLKKTIYRLTVGTVVFILISILAFTYWVTVVAFAFNNINIQREMIQIIQREGKGGPVYFFSDEMITAYLVVDYAKVENASRFPCLWMFTKFAKLAPVHSGPKAQALLQLQNNFFIPAVVDDLLRYKPTLIFVLTPAADLAHNGVHPDYIKIFSHDPRFGEFWRHYLYIGTVENYYVYKRDSP